MSGRYRSGTDPAQIGGAQAGRGSAEFSSAPRRGVSYDGSGPEILIASQAPEIKTVCVGVRSGSRVERRGSQAEMRKYGARLKRQGFSVSYETPGPGFLMRAQAPEIQMVHEEE